MAFNLDRFKSNLDSYGYLKNNIFEVGVQTPNFMLGSVLNNNGNISSMTDLNNIMKFRIDQTSVPGVSILSGDHAIYGVGPSQKMPYGAFFHDITFSILLDRKADFWNFWYNWVRYIYEFNGTEPNSRNFNIGGADGSYRTPGFTTRYKDDYSSMMQIIMYDTTGNVVQRVNLYEAFPSSVREIPLSWNDHGDLLRIAVSITYSHFSIEGSSFSNIPVRNPPSISGSITINPSISGSITINL
jgi:hypothetical protein